MKIKKGRIITMKENNSIEKVKAKKLEELKKVCVEYMETMESLDVDDLESFIFANDDYYDNGRK